MTNGIESTGTGRLMTVTIKGRDRNGERDIWKSEHVSKRPQNVTDERDRDQDKEHDSNSSEKMEKKKILKLAMKN